MPVALRGDFMRLISAIVAVELVLGTPAWAEDKATYQSLWDAVAQSPDCSAKDDVDIVIYTCDKAEALWYFTKPGHPAHPGVIKRAVVQDGKGVSVDEQGWSFAPDDAQPAFKTFMAQIQALDVQIKETMFPAGGNAPPPIVVGGNWTPQGGDNDAVVSLTRRYFSLEDGGHYDDAYALFDAAFTADVSFDRYRSLSDDLRTSAGQVKARTIKDIDWEKDSPLGPPGIYAALDYTAETEKGELCGYVAWQKHPDGFYTLVREESNIIPATLSAEDRAKVLAQFHCVQ